MTLAARFWLRFAQSLGYLYAALLIALCFTCFAHAQRLRPARPVPAPSPIESFRRLFLRTGEYSQLPKQACKLIGTWTDPAADHQSFEVLIAAETRECGIQWMYVDIPVPAYDKDGLPFFRHPEQVREISFIILGEHGELPRYCCQSWMEEFWYTADDLKNAPPTRRRASK